MIIVLCCFGGYAVICQFFKTDMPNPVIFSFFRDSVAFPILVCGAHFFEGIIYPSKKDLIMLILFGLLGMYGNQVLFILGLYNAGADSASLFQPAIPVFTSIFAILFCIEKPPQLFCKKDGDKRVSCAGWLKTIGILAVTAGGFVIYYGNKKKGKSSTTTSENKVFGEILLIGNCVCCSIYVLLQKKWVFSKEAGTTSSYLSKKWSKYPINLTAWTYLLGALFMLLHAIILIIENPKEIELNARVIYPILYASLLSSAVAYGLISYANSILPSSMVTAFWPLQVPVSVVLNFFVNGSEISQAEMVGGLIIIASLLMVAFSNRLMEIVNGNKNERNDCYNDDNNQQQLLRESDNYDTFSTKDNGNMI